MAVTTAPSHQPLPTIPQLPQPVQGIDLDTAYKALIEAYVDWRMSQSGPDEGTDCSKP